MQSEGGYSVICQMKLCNILQFCLQPSPGQMGRWRTDLLYGNKFPEYGLVDQVNIFVS